MDEKEKEYQEKLGQQKSKLEEFKKDLSVLLYKHNIQIREVDNYNGNDEYSGKEYFFVVNKETYCTEDIGKILLDL